MKIQHQSGFTVVELIVVIVLAAFVAGLFLVQKSDVRLRGEDSMSKQDINSIYHYLEGVYYPQHKGYPASLTANQLAGLDPESLKDSGRKAIGDKNSLYTYEPSGCQGDLCSGYRLTATLSKEAPFIRNNNTR